MPLGPPKPIATESLPATTRAPRVFMVKGETIAANGDKMVAGEYADRAPRRSQEAVANTSAFVMAKRLYHMRRLIDRGRLEHASPEAIRQLRDHADELAEQLKTMHVVVDQMATPRADHP